MTRRRFEAVLFDLDGTLIDSMPFLYEAVDTALAAHGAALDLEYFKYWHGHRVPLVELLAHHALPQVDEAEFRAVFGGIFLQRVREKVSWIPGAQEVLETLQSKGIRLGLITNAPPAYLAVVNERLKLDAYCSVMVTPQHVGGKPKPQPEGLWFAAKQLGAAREHCVYIGDQHFDVLAAYNAGVASGFIPSAHSGASTITPQFEFRQISEVLRLFDALEPKPGSR